MSRRKAIQIANNIHKITLDLVTMDMSKYDLTLREVGFDIAVYKKCYSLKIYKIGEILERSTSLAELYQFNDDELALLEESLIDIYNKVAYTQRLLNRILKRSNGECCVCITFKELLKISEDQFIELMESEYPNICEYELSEEKIRSWRDEYKQIVEHFIPVIKKHDRKMLKCHIVFELKLPKYRTDLDADEYVYADAVIVADGGFVVLEFKQRKSDVIDHYSTQALKYIKRLRFHRIGRHQKYRYTYMVCTKEPKNTLWTYDDREDFWFGNATSVAEDICTEFLDYVYPNEDIIGWLTAGYKQKKRR